MNIRLSIKFDFTYRRIFTIFAILLLATILATLTQNTFVGINKTNKSNLFLQLSHLVLLPPIYTTKIYLFLLTPQIIDNQQ